MSRMPRPPIQPDQTPSGIALDPQTLERVIPESRRPDGSVRKQLRIRPGFTPQEDVKKFRGTRQQQLEANALPKGHIIGWAPPPSSTASTTSGQPMSKSAKKNAKRKEKRDEKKVEAVVPDDWDADEPEVDSGAKPAADSASRPSETMSVKAVASPADKDIEGLSSTLEQLDVGSK